MSALDWIRKKSKQFDQYELEHEGGNYLATWRSFRGRIPNKMVYELRKELPSLINTKLENETLRIGGQYRSDFNNCEYIHVVYTKVD